MDRRNRSAGPVAAKNQLGYTLLIIVAATRRRGRKRRGDCGIRLRERGITVIIIGTAGIAVGLGFRGHLIGRLSHGSSLLGSVRMPKLHDPAKIGPHRSEKSRL